MKSLTLLTLLTLTALTGCVDIQITIGTSAPDEPLTPENPHTIKVSAGPVSRSSP